MKVSEYIAVALERGVTEFDIRFDWPTMNVNPEGLQRVKFKVKPKP